MESPSSATSYHNGRLLDSMEGGGTQARSPDIESRGGGTEVAAAGPWWQFGRDFWISVCFVTLVGLIPFVFAPSKSTLQSRATPYQVTANGDIILDFTLNQKLVKPATVPNAMLAVTGGIIPVLLVIAIGWRSPYHRAVITGLSGLFTAFGLSEIVTQSLKLYVARLRPNFYELCGWNMDDLKCDGEYRNVLESQLSFPSGHSSVSFCSCIYLLLFIVGHIGMSRTYYSASRRVLILGCGLLLVGWATFVASSRIHDNWHHPSDVLTGSIIGTMAAIMAYHTMYPPVYSIHAGKSLTTISEEKSAASDE